MTKILLIFIILISIFSCSKSDKKRKEIAEYQNKWTQKAEEQIAIKDLGKAFIFYEFVKQEDSSTPIGKIAKHKFDSLKVVIRNNRKKNFQGIWEWQNSGTNWGISKTNKETEIDKILMISDSSLSFFEVNNLTNDSILVSREKLKFNNNPSEFQSYFSLVYSNNQIWNYNIIETGQSLQLTKMSEMREGNMQAEILCGNLELNYKRIK